MVNQIRGRFEHNVLPILHRYSHVLVFGGVNDLYSDLTAGRTTEKITTDLTRLYTASRLRDVQVIAFTVAPWGGFKRYFNARRGEATLRLNDWIRKQGTLGTVRHVIDSYALLACGDALCPEHHEPFRDGIHFGPTGHASLGEALAQALPECSDSP